MYSSARIAIAAFEARSAAFEAPPSEARSGRVVSFFVGGRSATENSFVAEIHPWNPSHDLEPQRHFLYHNADDDAALQTQSGKR